MDPVDNNEPLEVSGIAGNVFSLVVYSKVNKESFMKKGNWTVNVEKVFAGMKEDT